LARGILKTDLERRNHKKEINMKTKTNLKAGAAVWGT
jgi:hypothetical protein